MMIIPSIDLLNGKVVRLIRGDPKYTKVYHDDPVRLAEEFVNKGVKLIHVVDLNAALERGNNRDIILDLASRGIPIQVGGGIRSIEAAMSLLNSGVRRVILGTLAYKRPDLLHEIIRLFGGDRVGVAIDYKGSRVMVRGWREEYQLTPLDAALQFQNMGIEWLILTSIERDGTLRGADISTLKNVRRHVNVKIIASGGVSSLEDILALKSIGVDGVILGKSLYEGLIKLEKALEVVNNTSS